jgi:TP901 family phage tail tape measure protein
MSLVDRLSGPINKAASGIKNMNLSAMSLSSRLALLAKSMLPVAAGAGALLMALSGPVKTAASFEAAMSGVKAISGGTEKEMTLLRKSALDLGAATSFSAMQVAEAQTELARLGFTADKIVSAMPGLLDLAAAAGVGLTEASTLTANALNAFGLEASQAGLVADIIAETANRSAGDVAGLGASLANAGAIANAAGVDFAALAAMTGKLADKAIDGSVAGTAIKGIISDLQSQSPTGDAAKVVKELGLVTQDAAGNMLPLFEILQQLEEKTASMGNSARGEVMKRLFGERGMGSAVALLETGTANLREFAGALRNAGGAAAKVAEVQLDNLQGSLTICASAWEGLQISIGDIFIPALRKGVDAISGLLNWLNQAAQHPIGKILIALAAAAATAAIAVTVLAGTMAAMNWAWPMVTGGLIKTKALFLSMGASAKASAASVLVWNNALRAGMISSMRGAGSAVASWVVNLESHVNRAGRALKGAAVRIKDAMFLTAVSARNTMAAVGASAASGLAGFGRAVKTGVLHPVATARSGLFAFGRGAKAVFLGLGSAAKSLLALMFNPLGILIGLAALLYLAWKNNFGGIRDIVAGVWDKINLVFSAIGQIWNTFNGTKFTLGKDMAESLESSGLMGIVMAIAGIIGRVKLVISGFWEAIQGGIGEVQEAIAPAMEAIGQVFEIIGNLISKVFGLFGGAEGKLNPGPWKTLGKIVGGALMFGLKMLAHVISAVWTALAWVIEKVAKVIEVFLDFEAQIFGAISSAWDSVVEFLENINLFEIGKAILGTLIDGIKSMFSGLFEAVGEAFMRIDPMLPMSDAKIGPFSHLTASGRAIPATIAEGVKSNAGLLRSGIMDMAQSMNNLPGPQLAAPGMPGTWSGYDFGIPQAEQPAHGAEGKNKKGGDIYVNTLHITMPEGTNAKSFADELKSLVRTRRVSND